MEVRIDKDGLARCWWGLEPDIYRSYHDDEWGRPVTDDAKLLEKVCLEGFQAGLSWLTILRKREAFRSAFAGFDPKVVAVFGDRDVGRLLANASIVRHEGKIRSAINNSRRAVELIAEHGSLAAFFWSGAELGDVEPTEIPPTTPGSIALSKELKRRGWTFVGPTTLYAFMQAVGIVNDHLPGCHARARCSNERRPVIETFG